MPTHSSRWARSDQAPSSLFCSSGHTVRTRKPVCAWAPPKRRSQRQLLLQLGLLRLLLLRLLLLRLLLLLLRLLQ
jgi:hypothetical protein